MSEHDCRTEDIEDTGDGYARCRVCGDNTFVTGALVPCGHPPECSFDMGDGCTGCGWCADRDHAKDLADQLESLRAQLAESEARREQWRETSDVQEGDLTTLRAAHEAALARVKVLEGLLDKVCLFETAKDHEIPFKLAEEIREALGRKGT